ncbi:MAG: hypothetical protein UHS55_00900, partial [Prevotella sp.]|nr:hypothetical protein [Prevotella sp.]
SRVTLALLGTVFQTDYQKITTPEDHQTTRPPNNKTTKQQDHQTTKPPNNKTTKQHHIIYNAVILLSKSC